MTDTTSKPPAKYPFGPQVALDICPEYSRLRAEEPVCRVEFPYGGEAWLVTTHAEASTVLSDGKFSRAATTGRDLPRWHPLPAVQGTFVNSDPPEHTRLKKLVSKAFTPHRIEKMVPHVERRSEEFLAALSAREKPADLVAAYTSRLPVAVTCDLLGISEDASEPMYTWKDSVVSVSALTEQEMYRFYGQLHNYVADTIEQRRRHPGDDLISALIDARDEGDRLTEQELRELTMVLIVAGNDTTANQLANYAFLLLTNGGHWRQLLDDPQLIPSAAEELARFIPFSTDVQPRAATEDVTLGGQLIHKGEYVVIALDSVNRDEHIFSDSDALQFERQPNPHLAYGFGPHFCLGAALARHEFQTAIRDWTRNFPGMRLAIPGSEVEWKTGLILRGPVELPVTW